MVYQKQLSVQTNCRGTIEITGLTIPVTQGRCALGTWQGIYLWEHRQHGHRRRLTVTVIGE